MKPYRVNKPTRMTLNDMTRVVSTEHPKILDFDPKSPAIAWQSKVTPQDTATTMVDYGRDITTVFLLVKREGSPDVVLTAEFYSDGTREFRIENPAS